MESVHPSADEATPAASSPDHKYSQSHQKSPKALREEFLQQACSQAKMKRVTEWVAECAAARQGHGGAAGTFGECDGETEDLLLQVLLARPKYQGIPTVEEIQQFAGQLRAYNARLWTLGMTKGFFRVGCAGLVPGERLGWVPEYPDDIDSLDSMSMLEEDREDGEEGEGANWVVHEKRVFVRKISPAEEELRDEMIQEYRNIRRHSVNDNGMMKRRRTVSVSTKGTARNWDGFSHMAGSNKENQMPSMVC